MYLSLFFNRFGFFIFFNIIFFIWLSFIWNFFFIICIIKLIILFNLIVRLRWIWVMMMMSMMMSFRRFKLFKTLSFYHRFCFLIFIFKIFVQLFVHFFIIFNSLLKIITCNEFSLSLSLFYFLLLNRFFSFFGLFLFRCLF